MLLSPHNHRSFTLITSSKLDKVAPLKEDVEQEDVAAQECSVWAMVSAKMALGVLSLIRGVVYKKGPNTTHRRLYWQCLRC